MSLFLIEYAQGRFINASNINEAAVSESGSIVFWDNSGGFFEVAGSYTKSFTLSISKLDKGNAFARIVIDMQNSKVN